MRQKLHWKRFLSNVGFLFIRPVGLGLPRLFGGCTVLKLMRLGVAFLLSTESCSRLVRAEAELVSLNFSLPSFSPRLPSGGEFDA